jgi:pseudouridine kinase
MTEREREILGIITKNPLISQNELADQLKITRSGAAAHIHNLINKGYLKGRGYILNEPKFVTVIGGINMDIMGISNEKLIEKNSNPGKISFSLGGAGRNIALTLTKLEIPNYFISVYGSDINGDKFVDDAKENEMNIQCCKQIPDASTSSFMYIDDVTGDRTVGIDDMEIYQQLTPKYLEHYLERINHSEYCIIDTNLPNETMAYLFEKVTVPIVVKTVSLSKNAGLIEGIEHIHTLVTTPEELLQIMSSFPQPKQLSLKAAIKFLRKKGVQNIAVFSSKHELYFQNENSNYYIKKDINEKSNTNGASAGFTGALIWALQNGMNWEQAVQHSYAAATLAIEVQEAVNLQLSPEYLAEKTRALFLK